MRHYAAYAPSLSALTASCYVINPQAWAWVVSTPWPPARRPSGQRAAQRRASAAARLPCSPSRSRQVPPFPDASARARAPCWLGGTGAPAGAGPLAYPDVMAKHHMDAS